MRFVEGVDGGWHDTQFLSQPGTTCLDNVKLTALSVANLRRETAELTWALPNQVPPNPLKDACIKRINFKSQWKVFAVYREGVEIGQWGKGEQSKHTPDPFAGPWSHWPVGLNPSDGRSTRFSASSCNEKHSQRVWQPESFHGCLISLYLTSL